MAGTPSSASSRRLTSGRTRSGRGSRRRPASCAGEVAEVCPLGVFELKRPGDCLEDLLGRMGRAALLEADVVIDADARELGKLLAAQPRDAAAAEGGQADLPRAQPVAAGFQELPQLGALVHPASMPSPGRPRVALAIPGHIGPWLAGGSSRQPGRTMRYKLVQPQRPPVRSQRGRQPPQEPRLSARRQPRAPRHRLHRRLLGPRLGRLHPGGGGRARSRRRRERREGALRGHLRHPGLARVPGRHPGRPARLDALRRSPGPVQPGRAGGGA